MSDLIYRQVEQAIKSGRIIQAIKLLRKVENLNLSEAKERIEQMADKLRGVERESYPQQKTDREILEASSRPRAHSHAPARSGVYNIEGDLPTEAFLFFQRGEVEKGIKVIETNKGVNKNSAIRMAKMFYQQHPEYTSAEIGRFMGVGSKERDYSISTMDNSSTKPVDNTKANNTKKTPKKKNNGGSLFKTIFFFIIFINIIRAIID